MALEDAPSYADLQREVASPKRELTESLAREAATAEVLGVIADSPTELRPVLDTIAREIRQFIPARNEIAYRGCLLGEASLRACTWEMSREQEQLDQ